jgi:hypothetical protein
MNNRKCHVWWLLQHLCVKGNEQDACTYLSDVHECPSAMLQLNKIHAIRVNPAWLAWVVSWWVSTPPPSWTPSMTQLNWGLPILELITGIFLLRGDSSRWSTIKNTLFTRGTKSGISVLEPWLVFSLWELDLVLVGSMEPAWY